MAVILQISTTGVCFLLRFNIKKLLIELAKFEKIKQKANENY
tara:strand:- start:179 stop:304 length:126 start_codon:yes stop_codon:yes gene_type:complete